MEGGNEGGREAKRERAPATKTCCARVQDVQCVVLQKTSVQALNKSAHANWQSQMS